MIPGLRPGTIVDAQEAYTQMLRNDNPDSTLGKFLN